MKLSSSVKFACIAVATAITTSAFASGFQLTEMSAKKLGQANAGAAAYGDDASTIFWNAAGLTNLDGSQLSVNGSIVSIDSGFDRTQAIDAFGSPLTGNNGGDITTPAFVPAMFYARHAENFSWGVGVHAPFGLTTDYDSDSIFRYQALKSEVTVIDINPAIAFKRANTSFGFGLDLQYMHVELTSALDFGTACFSTIGQINPALIPSQCVANGLTPQAADGTNVTEGDGFALGWNAGILHQNGPLSLGASYRSSVDHELEGDATFTNAPALFTSQGQFLNSAIEADFESPSLAMFSAKYDVNPNWTVAADISWTTWSNFEELSINYLDSNQANTVEAFEWEDVYRYSLGVEYMHSDTWTFRTGVAYDQSPIFEAERGARLPSSNRTWLALGASYNLSSGSSFDLGYVHLFIDDPIQFNRTGSFSDTIIGEFNADADLFSFQYTHKF